MDRIAIYVTKAQADLLVYALRKQQQEFEPYNSPSLDALVDSVQAQIALAVEA